MYILSSIIFLWAHVVVFAYPLKHRASADIEVFAFAHVLEQLESAFYAQALKQFNASSFKAAGFASSQIPLQQIQTIAGDENVHAATLQAVINALGGQVIANCTFNFSLALTDVNRMIATARVVENVGVSAYLGALSALKDPTLVTAASSIMTVEARHQTILNLLSSGTSIPQPFDVALSPADVLAIADPFISGCKLGVSANPSLNITNSGPLQAGTKLNFSSPALNGSASYTSFYQQLSCRMVTGGLNASVYHPIEDCMVPANVTGPMYVFITKDQAANSRSTKTNRGTNSSTVLAGPTLLFINHPDFIGDLIRPNSNATGAAAGNGTSSTPTISTPTSSTPPSLTSSKSPIPGTSSPLSASPLTPLPGVYTTTLSPSQASAILSSLTGY